MTKTTLGCLTFALGLTACIDDSSSSIGETDQAATVYNDCAVGSDSANAMEYSINVGDTYTRAGTTINQAASCDCKAWQVEKNASTEADANRDHPKCRPTTIVEFGLGPYERHLQATVDSWSVGNQTECENSTLNVKIQKFDYSVGDYVTITGGASGDLNPTWSGGVCLPRFFGMDVPVPTGGSDDYRIRAKATRGLDQFNHGYEGVRITAQ